MNANAPVYRRNMDDAPRPVAVMARTLDARPPHPAAHAPARAVALCGQRHHAGGDRGGRLDPAAGARPLAAAAMAAQRHHAQPRRDAHDLYRRRPACAALPAQPMLAEISGLLRELILTLLEEPADYDEDGRGGIVARLMLTELTRLSRTPSRGADAARPARACGWRAPCSRTAHSPMTSTAGPTRPAPAGARWPASSAARPGSGFAEWRARLRAIDGLARLSDGASVADTAAAGRLCQPERLLGHDPPHRSATPPRRLLHNPM